MGKNIKGFVIAVLFFLCGNSIGQNFIDVSSNKQLFIDDKFVESSKGVTRTMNKPHQFEQVVLTNDQPWESEPSKYVAVYCSVLKDDGKIKLWYDYCRLYKHL